jgi:hypothetical protein
MKTKILSVLLPAIILCSCKKDKVGDEIDKISMNYIPVLVPDDVARIQFTASGGVFDCGNVSIDYKLDNTSKEILLRFGDSYIPDGMSCYSTGSHSGDEANVSFDMNVNPGDYSFEIVNKGATLRAGLHIDDKKISLVNASGTYITFSQNDITLYRVPKDAIWGYVKSTAAEFTPFRDSLLARGCTDYAPQLENGNYAYFRITGGQYVPDYSGYDEYPQFLMKTSLDTAALHGIINYFCDNTTTGSIQLYDGKGNQIYHY